MKKFLKKLRDEMTNATAIVVATVLITTISIGWKYFKDFSSGFLPTIGNFFQKLLYAFSILVNDSIGKTFVNFSVLGLLILGIVYAVGRILLSRVKNRHLNYYAKAIKNYVEYINLLNTSSLFSISEEDIMNSLADIFLSKAKDVEIVWLRPKIIGSNVIELYKASDRITVQKKKLYRKFISNDGLAGTVWFNGIASHYSSAHRNGRFDTKQGCENQTYIAVPFQAIQNNPFGILSVGSDSGFEFEQIDAQIVALYASILLQYERNKKLQL